MLSSYLFTKDEDVSVKKHPQKKEMKLIRDY
jgi:hypothetical protein